MAWEFVTQFSIDTIAALLAAFTSIIIAYTAYKTAKRSVDQTKMVLVAQKTSNRPYFGKDNITATASIQTRNILVHGIDEKMNFKIGFTNTGGTTALITEIVLRNATDDSGMLYSINTKISIVPGATSIFVIKNVRIVANHGYLSLIIKYIDGTKIEYNELNDSFYEETFDIKINISKTFDIFLCYSAKDHEYAEEMVPIFKKAGYSIANPFLLREDFMTNDSLSGVIESSNTFVLLMSEIFPFTSSIVMNEIHQAVLREKRILTVNITGDDLKPPLGLENRIIITSIDGKEAADRIIQLINKDEVS